MTKLAYIDSGVLITAAVGTNEIARRNAAAVIDDTNRKFASSFMVQLEVLLKAIYFKNVVEIAYYSAFFDSVTAWYGKIEEINDSLLVSQKTEIISHTELNLAAYKYGCKYGLGGSDALQIAAAITLEADEFVTSERLTSPLFRVTELKVTSIR